MKVAVLVDLFLSAKSGGHVKYWQRISESIEKKNHDLDLTVFFLGTEKKIISLRKNVRYSIVKPILSSKILKIFGVDADSTDLFPLNFKLLHELKKYDLIHTTDQFFSMSKTALLANKIWKIPLTTSIHTDTPPYTKYYVEKILNNIFKHFFGLNTLLINKFKIPEKFEKKMFNKIYYFLKKSDHGMVADKIYSPQALIKKTKNSHITKLNRGINDDIFFLKKEKRKKVLKKYNIPPENKILFFSGRIHELKGAILLSKIHRRLNEAKINVSTIMAGEDIHGRICKDIGKKGLTLVGYLKQKDLAEIYRICDFFVFPSNFEIGPNVVLEAKACGAVVVVSPNGGGKRVNKSGEDGIIIKNLNVDLWVKTLKKFIMESNKIQYIKKNLKNQNKVCSWSDILEFEILPHWKRVIKEE